MIHRVLALAMVGIACASEGNSGSAIGAQAKSIPNSLAASVESTGMSYAQAGIIGQEHVFKGPAMMDDLHLLAHKPHVDMLVGLSDVDDAGRIALGIAIASGYVLVCPVLLSNLCFLPTKYGPLLSGHWPLLSATTYCPQLSALCLLCMGAWCVQRAAGAEWRAL